MPIESGIVIFRTFQSLSNKFVMRFDDTPNIIWLFVVRWHLGCDITAKAEHLNPGGSVKDRAALYLIKEAEEKGMFAVVKCFPVL